MLLVQWEGGDAVWGSVRGDGEGGVDLSFPHSQLVSEEVVLKLRREDTIVYKSEVFPNRICTRTMITKVSLCVCNTDTM